MIRSIAFIAFSWTTLLATQTAFAQARIPCPSCSEQGYANAAASRGIGDHHVFDLPAGQLRRYQVECMSNSLQSEPVAASASNDASSPDAAESELEAYEATMYGCDGWLIPNEAMPEPGVVEAFGHVKAVFDETGGTFAKQVEVSSRDIPTIRDSVPSAYDVVGNVNLRSAISDSLTTEVPNASASVNWVLAHPLAAAGLTDGVTVTVTVVFPDGSTMKYQCELGRSATYVEGSARTPGGQVIPDSNSAGYTGEWVWLPYGASSEEDLERMFRHLRDMGVPIERNDSDRIRKISCTWDGATLRCTIT